MRGDKIGIIGPNGAGKTTLLRMLLGPASAAGGNGAAGDEPADRLLRSAARSSSNDEASVQDNVGDGYETVDDRRQLAARHRLSAGLSVQRPSGPARRCEFLSGGERNRVLLAKLFAKPANVIVLDEPTNDLDAETLELLEERLVEFDGTVLLVSHDRDVPEQRRHQHDRVRRRRRARIRRRLRRLAAAAAAAGQSRVCSDTSPTRQRGKTARYYFQDSRISPRLPQAQLQRTPGARLAPCRHRAVRSRNSDPPPRHGRARVLSAARPRIAQEQARLKQLEEKLAAAFERWVELEGVAR